MSDQCPYCESEIDPEMLPPYDDDSVEIECDDCGKKFRIRAVLDFITRKNCEWNEEDHEWDSYFDDSECEHCNKCDEIRVRER